MSDQLSDEILSVNSIYAEQTLTEVSSPPSSIYALLLPDPRQISLRLEFPPDYPDTPPSVLGTQGTGPDVPKGAGVEVADLARRVLSEVYVPGNPCVYDLVEDLLPRLAHLPSLFLTPESSGQQIGQDCSPGPDGVSSDPSQQAAVVELGPPPPWTISEPVTEKKSVFVARCARVKSPVEAKSYLAHLLATDKRVARATHNMTAWRIRGEGVATYQDCDDDGETAAGSRLLHLLQLMDAWDIMVVVSRWYGGVKLGPDRFRLIGQVARDAIVKGGFAEEGGKGKKK